MVTTCSRYFDLLKEYHQIEVDESSREKTAFTTHVGLFNTFVYPLD